MTDSRLSGLLFRVGVFVIVMLLGMFALMAAFGQFRFGGGNVFNAVFTNVSGLKNGNFVRVAGVEVGKVDDIAVNDDATVRVKFTIANSLKLLQTTRAEIRYDDLIGGRYLELTPGVTGGGALKPGQTIPTAQTKPALDLESVTGGFRPLLRGVNPEQLNALSGQLMTTLRGEGPSIGVILDQAAAVTNTLADRDLLIGEIIGNLDVVLGSLGGHADQLDKAVTSFSELVGALASRKAEITNAVVNVNAASGSLTDLLAKARQPFQKVVREADRTAGNVLLNHDYLEKELDALPDRYRKINRQAIYGNYFSFYFCNILLKLNGKGGEPVYVKVAGQSAGRCLAK